PRQAACGAFALLMLLISLTGNYCFFNLLTVALCVLLLDDGFLMRLLPASAAAFVKERLPSRSGSAYCSVGPDSPPTNPPATPPDAQSGRADAPVTLPSPP